jgi:hypothetical protein
MTHNLECIVDAPTHGGQISADGHRKSNYLVVSGEVKWTWVRNYCRCECCQSLRAKYFRMTHGQPENEC